jgi:hypothetical protein
LPTDSNDDVNKLSFVIIKFGDIGPEPVLYENTKLIFEQDMEDVLGTQLGIYLSLMISKGKQGEHKIGFHGPFPWAQTPNHNLLAFSFLGRDKNVKDPRAIEHGLITIIAIFYLATDQELIKAKLSIENELQKLFIKEPFPDVGMDNLPMLLALSKARISKSIVEGDRIIQENAMDSLLSNERLLYLGLYQANPRELIAPLIGDEEQFIEIISETKNFHFDIFFTKYREMRFGLINLQKYQKIIIMIIQNTESENQEHVFMEKDFLQIYQAIYIAGPLLEEYYG